MTEDEQVQKEIVKLTNEISSLCTGHRVASAGMALTICLCTLAKSTNSPVSSIISDIETIYDNLDCLNIKFQIAKLT